jgi:tRNA(Ile)-lysidine synthase
MARHGIARPGDRFLVGVSGGADSVCLARVLGELGLAFGMAHVNHGLRGPDSDGDQVFVEELAARLDVPLFVRPGGPPAGAGNLEAGAREIRRAFFRELLETEGFARVLLAHSKDDRVETFLLHLLRGSGTAGLVSMEPVVGWIGRPLLEVGRPRIEAYLRDIGQPWRSDRSNQDTRFTRNRVRHDLLPSLEADFNPRLRETLSRTIEVLSAENAWMEAEAETWVRAHLTGACSWSGPGPPGLSGSEFARLELDDLGGRPRGFVRRVLRTTLSEAGSDLRDLGFDHLEQVRSLLGPGKSGRVVEIPGAVSVERAFDSLLFRPDAPAPAPYEYELPIPGRVSVPEAGLRFEARVLAQVLGTRTREAGGERAASATRVRVDGESLGPCVKIRNWKNGDTYEPAGLRKSKLKALFAERRIPRSTRLRWPVFVARSSIVWVPSFPVSREFVPAEHTRRIVEFEAFPADVQSGGNPVTGNVLPGKVSKANIVQGFGQRPDRRAGSWGFS